jgi:hypothetical protein
MDTDNYLKTDDDKIINDKYIRWAKKIDECMYVCTKSNGCALKIETHTICKINNPKSYYQLSFFFK